MSVSCPHCQTRVPLVHAFGFGPVLTSRGSQVWGIADEMTGVVDPADQPLRVLYPLEGKEYTISVCGECNKEFVSDHYRPIWPLPTAAAPSEVPEDVREPFVEALKAHAVGAETAALLAARTSLIRMQREQKVSRISDL